MTRSVADAAVVLSVIAGKDLNDVHSLAQPTPVVDYTNALRKDALNGKRIGVPRKTFFDDPTSGLDPYVKASFEDAVETMRGLGATIVDPADLPSAEELAKRSARESEKLVFRVDFKVTYQRLMPMARVHIDY